MRRPTGRARSGCRRGLEEDLPAAPGPLPVSLHPVGGGSQHVATVYADDLADLVLRALERGFGY